MNLNGKKVLITGGAGFLGSHLVDALLSKEAKVTVIDIFNPEEARNIKHVMEKITYIKCDISDKEQLAKINADFNVIYNLAAIASPKFCEDNPEITFRLNVVGTYNVLNAFATRNGIEKFIFTSSSLVYGKFPKYLPIDEKHPIFPTESVYNFTKIMGEELVSFFRERYKVPAVTVRLSTTFGPRQSRDYLIPTLILQAIEKKKIEIWNDKPAKDFTYVDDTVGALVRCAESDFVGGPINISCGVKTRVGDIANEVAKNFGAELFSQNKEVLGPMETVSDNSLTKSVLGWEPRTSPMDGLVKTIEWFRNKYGR